MSQPPVLLVLAPALAALLCAVLASYSFFRRRLRGATEFGLLVAAISVYAMGYSVELARTSIPDILLAVKVEYLGLAFIPCLALLFALRLSREKALPPAFVAALVAFPALTVLIAWTVEWHDLLYIAPRAVDNGLFVALEFGRGPWYLANYAYSLLASVAGIVVILVRAANSGRKEREQALVVAAGGLFPVVAVILRFFGIVPSDLDTGSLTACVSALFYAYALFRLGLFELVPVARELALDSIREGFVVVDEHGHLQDINAAARDFPGFEALRPGTPLPAGEHLPGNLRSLLESGEGEREFQLVSGGVKQRFAARAYPIVERRLRMRGNAVIVTDVTERARLLDRLTVLAETDPLTGIPNRRHLMELGALQLELARRTGSSIGAVMIDLDRFKDINDRFGHETGDEVLRFAVERFKAGLRAVDFVGRFGGEEFVVILPGTDLQGSLKIAERLRAGLAAEPLTTGGREIAMTASLGVHAGPVTAGSRLDDWLRAADEALYEAKRKGRNRVEARGGGTESGQT